MQSGAWLVPIPNCLPWGNFLLSRYGGFGLLWGLFLLLGAVSLFAWNFGSPLKRFRKALVWLWLLSVPANLWLLYGLPGMETVPTIRWGGFLLTVILSIVGIGVSFPIGLMLALGRRSEVRGVPFLWVYGVGLLFIYWGFGGYPSEPVTLNIPLLFRDPPIWVVTLSPLSYALLQALFIVGIFWAIGHFLGGNIIKAFSVIYIEMIRGVPLITVLFMAQILLPIFLPKGFEIDNLLRVVVGIILFSAAYLAENVRGGLQAIPKGQFEAGMAVGLSTAQSMRMIIMPQALRLVIPAIVGQFHQPVQRYITGFNCGPVRPAQDCPGGCCPTGLARLTTGNLRICCICLLDFCLRYVTHQSAAGEETRRWEILGRVASGGWRVTGYKFQVAGNAIRAFAIHLFAHLLFADLLIFYRRRAMATTIR